MYKLKIDTFRKEFCSKINVVKGVNLRFKENYNVDFKKKNDDSILVVLNLDHTNTNMIIEEILKTNFCKSGKKKYL